MKFGIRTLLPGIDPSVTSQAIHPGELASEVEARGFESLWFPEHTHIPVGVSALPDGRPLPGMYLNTLDPFIALTAAGAATSDLRIATGVCLLAQRDPIVLAKQIVTLDLLTRGRFSLGVGFGWNRSELENHGVPWAARRAVVRERVLAMKALWTSDVAEYQGRHVAFGPAWAWPKPVQRPHPPIYVGAQSGPRTFADIVAYADGWLPNRFDDVSRIPELLQRAADCNRDPSSLSITFYGAGIVSERSMEVLTTAGVERVVFTVRSGSRSEVLGDLDDVHQRIARFRA